MDFSWEVLLTILGIAGVNLFVWVRLLKKRQPLTADDILTKSSSHHPPPSQDDASSTSKTATFSSASSSPSNKSSTTDLAAHTFPNDDKLSPTSSRAVSSVGGPGFASVSTRVVRTAEYIDSTDDKLDTSADSKVKGISNRDRYLGGVRKAGARSKPHNKIRAKTGHEANSDTTKRESEPEIGNLRVLSKRDQYLKAQGKKRSSGPQKKKQASDASSASTHKKQASSPSSVSTLTPVEQIPCSSITKRINESDSSSAFRTKINAPASTSSPTLSKRERDLKVQQKCNKVKDTDVSPLPVVSLHVKEPLERQFPNKQKSRLSYLRRSAPSKTTTPASTTVQSAGPSTHVGPSQDVSYDAQLLKRARTVVDRRPRKATSKIAAHKMTAMAAATTTTTSTTKPKLCKQLQPASTVSRRQMYLQQRGKKQNTTTTLVSGKTSKTTTAANNRLARRQQLLVAAQQKQQQRFVDRQKLFLKKVGGNGEILSEDINQDEQQKHNIENNQNGIESTTEAAIDDETDALLDDMDLDDLFSDDELESQNETVNDASVDSKRLENLLATTFSEDQRDPVKYLLAALSDKPTDQFT